MKRMLQQLKKNRFAKLATILLTFAVGLCAAKIYFAWVEPFQPESFASLEQCRDKASDFVASTGWQMESGMFEGGRMGLYEVKFSSAEAAQKCYQAKMQTAFRLVEQKPLLDETSKTVVGNSFSAVYPPTQSDGRDWTMITSVEGNQIRQFYQNNKLKLTSDR